MLADLFGMEFHSPKKQSGARDDILQSLVLLQNDRFILVDREGNVLCLALENNVPD